VSTADTLAETLLDLLEEEKDLYTTASGFLLSLLEYLEYTKISGEELVPDVHYASRRKLQSYLGSLLPLVRNSDLKLRMFICLLQR
jgi:hypothetical protein